MLRRARWQTRVLVLHYRPLLGRLSVLLFLIASVWLIASGKPQGNFVHNVRTRLADTVIPVVSVIAKPVDATLSFIAWVEEIATMEEQNRVLKAENEKLRQWYSSVAELKTENERLRALLKFAPVDRQGYTSARVAVDSDSPYSRSVLITSGSDNGVRDDAAVINDKGMVGRIIETGSKTARVLLLTDVNSRIPVMSEGSREHSIAAGGGSDTLTLMYLPDNSKLRVGEKIVTSGDGALIPPGLPVGVVSKIEKDAVTVKTFADWYRLEYVSVINF